MEITRGDAVSTRPRSNPMYILAGVGAILFPPLNSLSLRFFDTELLNEPVTITNLIRVVAYVLLLPMVYVLYRELSASSRLLSVISSLSGLIAPMATVLEVFGILGPAANTVITGIGLAMWIGLVGYVALSRNLLPSAWAGFSLAIGIISLFLFTFLALGASNMVSPGQLVVSVFAVLNTFSCGLLGFSVFGTFIWFMWTGIMIIGRTHIVSEDA